MKNKKNLKKYLFGASDVQAAGVATKPAATANLGGAMGGWGALLNMIPGVINGVIDLAENNPKAYSKEPLVNSSVMRNMVSPYAFGGEVSSIEDLDEEQLTELQQLADENGLDVEEMFMQLQEQEQGEVEEEDVPIEEDEELDIDNDPNGFFALGGIAIGTELGDENKKKKRKKDNTPTPNNYGKYNGIIDENGKAVDVPTADAAIRTMVNYMINNKPSEFVDDGSNVYRNEFQHFSITQPLVTKPTAAYGMQVGKKAVPIEVEGKEVLETPSGNVKKVEGPSHEAGGVDVTVPSGTKIFSDRISIDGKTMAQRKASRERSFNKIQKALDGNPSDIILKRTAARTATVNEIEEAKDMQVQEIVDNAAGKGQVKKFAYGTPYVGDESDPNDPFNIAAMLAKYQTQQATNTSKIPFKPNLYTGKNSIGRGFSTAVNITPSVPESPTVVSSPTDGRDEYRVGQTGFFEGLPPDHPDYLDPATPRATDVPYSPPAAEPKIGEEGGQNMTPGDYVGMAGNLFNAIAPIINTKNSRATDKPNINRFKKFGKDALDTNFAAEGLAAKDKGYGIVSANSTANARKAGNRNSAMGVNTLRALDLATDLTTDKAVNSINDSFTKQMIGILSNRSGLQNQRDMTVMRGETARDTEDKADKDNYYSNMAANLVNAGTNVQGIGKSLNVAKSNEIDTELLNQLSQYGLGYRNGKLVTLTKKNKK